MVIFIVLNSGLLEAGRTHSAQGRVQFTSNIQYVTCLNGTSSEVPHFEEKTLYGASLNWNTVWRGDKDKEWMELPTLGMLTLYAAGAGPYFW